MEAIRVDFGETTIQFEEGRLFERLVEGVSLEDYKVEMKFEEEDVYVTLTELSTNKSKTYVLDSDSNVMTAALAIRIAVRNFNN